MFECLLILNGMSVAGRMEVITKFIKENPDKPAYAGLGMAKYFDDELTIKALGTFFLKAAANGITSMADCAVISFMRHLMSDEVKALFDF